MADEQDARLERIEVDVRELKSDMKEVRLSLAKIEGALPHFATKEEVEQAKHEATKGKYGMIVGVVAIISSFGALFARIFIS